MEYKIYVGALMEIKKGFLKGTFQIMYCGMPNEKTFVLSPYVSQGYQGFSPSIYYNVNAAFVHIMDRDFDVLEVTPEYIILGD